MTVSQKGLDLIKRHEGLKLESYKCPGDKWTIGFGTTLGIVEGMTVTLKAAEELLERDVHRFSEKVSLLLRVPVTQNQFDALISLAYNIGAGALAKSTLLQMVNAGDYAGASQEFGKWVKSNGKVLGGLINRRREEKELFLS